MKHVGDPGEGRDERQISDPQLVGRGGGEIPTDKVGVPLRPWYRSGGADPFGATRTFDAGRAHQPGDLIAADVVTSPAGGFPQLAGTVDAVMSCHSCTRIGVMAASRRARADGDRFLAA